MGDVCPKTLLYAYRRFRVFARFATKLSSYWTLLRASAQPSLSPPVWSNDLTHAQLTIANCTNASLQYIPQLSFDLSNWVALQTNRASATNFSIMVATTNQYCFYRLVTAPVPAPVPLFQAAIIVKSNVTMIGNSLVVDSFDSSSPLYSTAGQYDVLKRKANGNVATDSPVIDAISVGNGNIYGKVVTGPGTVQSAVVVGSQGAVGDIGWNTTNRGIEPNYWSGDFSVNIPDVAAPSASASLPAASNGVIYLNSGHYFTATDPGKQIYINGPVILWVTSSYTANIAFNSNNTSASLALYVGATSGSGVSLSLSGSTNLNYPGYARNLQIYGLPSLISVNISGNAAFVGTIYAPEALVTGSGGGINFGGVGAIVAQSMELTSHWSLHYDESLATNGPTF